MAGKASFNWIDPLLLDQQLTEEERMVQASAAQFAADKLAPRVLEAFRHERTDPAIFREMGETGLLGATIPEAYGGSGLNYVCYGLIAREVERIDSGYRSMMSVQSSLVMVPIFEFGNEATRQKYLPKLASGEYIGCFGLTEPNHGSDPGSMVTRAKRSTAAIACPAARCGLPTARSPMSSWSGPRMTPARFAASCWKRAGKGCPPRRFTEKSACAPRSPARSSWTTCSARKRTPSPTCAG